MTWRFVWTEVVLKITTQKTTYKTSFRSFSVQTVGASTTKQVKKKWILTTFLETYVLHYGPDSWSSGQSLCLLIMRSWVRFPVLPWEFSLKGRIPTVTMVWVG